ncbi:similar to Saccharomyces cerevisiae YPL162C Putative protein of unknown function [Maudiozyma barnettii]|uniref:Vacuolar membrane protein n=1 Tax=Maudiozyma barnettii TaxID=61262 RepID=A0A8H2VCG5_9SACH|nr:hypothetical protein [Kazachstania barnettii]CAB4252711.1 similar to Saccharomyces cerevisiae YPL162C Putative protein of unknown function [Kazachstania barnettii]CAD1780501.1 similar to Saccharomyces cerevisiae YPL162C Putative protein of unknown function [Kazachstania barnettii]
MTKRIPKTGTCQLLGPVSLVIQLLMGILVVIVLLIKREYEHPRRKLIVWCYDTGKQIGGSLSIHFINLGLSIIKKKRQIIVSILLKEKSIYNLLDSSSDDSNGDDDQCDWYFLNLLLDTTFGIPILWLALKLLQRILSYLKIQNVESGNYYSTDDRNIHKKILFSAFLRQLLVFITGLIVMKFFVFLFLNFFEDAAYWFANIILGWADKWPNFQVFLVMFVSPVLLNCFQYCCIDNIIKLHSVDYTNIDNFEQETLFSDDDYDHQSSSPASDNFLTKFRRYRRVSNNDSSLYGSIN